MRHFPIPATSPPPVASRPLSPQTCAPYGPPPLSALWLSQLYLLLRLQYFPCSHPRRAHAPSKAALAYLLALACPVPGPAAPCQGQLSLWFLREQFRYLS